MKKEYIKPEAEMMKFVETEEIMAVENNLFSGTSYAIERPDGIGL